MCLVPVRGCYIATLSQLFLFFISKALKEEVGSSFFFSLSRFSRTTFNSFFSDWGVGRRSLEDQVGKVEKVEAVWCSFFSTPENRPQVADETWLSTHEVLLQVQGQSRKTNSRTHKKNRRNFRFLDKIVKRHRRNASRCSSVQPEKSQRSLNSSNSIHPSTIHDPIQQEKTSWILFICHQIIWIFSTCVSL